MRQSQAERGLGPPLLWGTQMHFDSYTSLPLEGKERSKTVSKGTATCLCCGPGLEIAVPCIPRAYTIAVHPLTLQSV